MTGAIDITMCREVPAAVIRSGVQRVFLNRLRRARNYVRRVVVISPWITAQDERSCPFSSLIQLIRSRSIATYVFTRSPSTAAHTEAAESLRSCPTVELIYNDNVHAKIYACLAPPPHAFALLGSANLTANSITLYEIGLLILGISAGSSIVADLGNFGLQHLRTRPESKVVKRIDVRSIRHAI